MSTSFDLYEEARSAAQTLSNSSGMDYGIEKMCGIGKYWRIFLLPKKEFRFGLELRCEVVSCEFTDRTAIGHGYRHIEDL